jgi:hypothetical protein
MQQFFSDLDVLGEAFRTVIPLLEARDAALRKEFPALAANVKNAVARVSGKKRGARRLVRSGELSKMVSSVERLIAAVRRSLSVCLPKRGGGVTLLCAVTGVRSEGKGRSVTR